MNLIKTPLTFGFVSDGVVAHLSFQFHWSSGEQPLGLGVLVCCLFYYCHKELPVTYVRL